MTEQVQENGKIRIGGIKLSRELILLKQSFSVADNPSIFPIYARLAQGKINITYLSAIQKGKLIHISCLAANEEFNQIQCLQHADSNSDDHIEILPGKSTLSLFPHQGRFDLLGRILGAFGEAHIKLYGFSSSISALTFVIDYNQQETAVSAIIEYLELPHNHTPFQSALSFVEKRS
ncbi:hypothetical protein ACFL9U_04185 [Thermodesulfobacteriota bacterium]